MGIAGLALLWPCLQSSGFYPFSLVTSIGDANPAIIAQLHLVYSMELLVAFVFIMCLGKRFERLFVSSRAIPLIAGACGVAGQALLSYGAQSDALTSALVMVALPMIAVFIATFVVLWGVRFSQPGLRHAVLDVAISYLCSQILIILWCLLGLPFNLFLCGCALLSAIFAIFQPRDYLNNSEAFSIGERRATIKSIPWRIVGIVTLLIWFCIVYVRWLLVGYDGDSSNAYKLFASFLSACTFALTVLYLKRKPDAANRLLVIMMLFIGVYMLALVGISLLADAGSALPRRILIASEHCLEAFLWMILCDTVTHKRLSPALVFGLFGIAVVDLPWVFSFDLRYLSGVTDEALQNGWLYSLSTVMLFVIAILSIVFLYLRMKDLQEKSTQQTTASQQEIVSQALEGIGLTQRELEVATLVYRGYTAKRIAQMLYVSEPTVKNYTSRVYRKLDIHTKQELIEYIDAQPR